jgi:hypothetical protein
MSKRLPELLSLQSSKSYTKVIKADAGAIGSAF